jgi:hypothetical protein
MAFNHYTLHTADDTTDVWYELRNAVAAAKRDAWLLDRAVHIFGHTRHVSDPAKDTHTQVGFVNADGQWTPTHPEGRSERIQHLEALFAEQKISEANGARTVLDDDGRPRVEMATCGTCGMSWNDALISERTPVPSARCPYEHIHDELRELRRLKARRS